MKGMVAYMLTSLEIVELTVKLLDNKKARDIKVLKTKDITVLADYFVICTAGSTIQIKALVDEVGKTLRDKGEPPLHTEGYRGGGWVLMDFASIVVHIFLQDIREFYALERLWTDAPVIDLSEWITAEDSENIKGLV